MGAGGRSELRGGVTCGGAVVDALVRVARPIILESYRPDSCLASTNIAIGALGFFGITATAVSCRAMVWNGVYSERYFRDDNVRPLDDPEAWAVGIGHYDANWRQRQQQAGLEPTEPYWGHLVAVTTDQLIDLSLDQAARPERGLDLRPLAVPLDPRFVKGSRAVYATDEGVHLIYEPDGRPPSAWQRHWNRGPIKATTGKVIRAVRAELSSLVP